MCQSRCGGHAVPCSRELNALLRMRRSYPLITLDKVMTAEPLFPSREQRKLWSHCELRWGRAPMLPGSTLVEN